MDEVRIEGGLENGAIGSAGASVHWRDGLIRRAATVTEASSRQQARALEGDGPVVIGSVGATLVALHPELQTSRSDHQTRSDFGAWRVPRWVNVLAVVTVLGSVGLLIAGPQPRLATRWAWFWLMSTVPPVGFLVFLVLSGLLSTRPRADPGRRLTGGWAFLLTIVVGAGFRAGVSAFGG